MTAARWSARMALIVCTAAFLVVVMLTWGGIGDLGVSAQPSPSPSPTRSPSPSPSESCRVPIPAPPPICPSPSGSPSASPSGSPTPGGETERHRSRISISYSSAKVLFKGVVKSDAKCIRGRRVILFKVKKGADRLKGRDSTDQRGRWVVDKKRARGRYYARVVQKSGMQMDTAYVCRAARSETIRAR